MSIRTAPCDWPLIGCSDGEPDSEECPTLASLGEAQRQAVEEAATSYLWNWTGRRFGTCEVTLRPCREDCLKRGSTYLGRTGIPDAGFHHGSGSGWLSALVGGSWRSLACGTCRSGGCSCREVSEVRLPGPIDKVEQVKVDGEVLSSDAYETRNRTRLVRVDGKRWPVCQNLGDPDDEPGTWSVRYLWGTPVPAGGRLAAGLLACELGKALCRDRSCALPERVTSITREGVSFTVLDAFEGLEAGRTGLWLVDSWVSSVTEPKRRSRVWSPDTSRPEART